MDRYDAGDKDGVVCTKTKTEGESLCKSDDDCADYRLPLVCIISPVDNFPDFPIARFILLNTIHMTSVLKLLTDLCHDHECADRSTAGGS